MMPPIDEMAFIKAVLGDVYADYVCLSLDEMPFGSEDEVPVVGPYARRYVPWRLTPSRRSSSHGR